MLRSATTEIRCLFNEGVDAYHELSGYGTNILVMDTLFLTNKELTEEQLKRITSFGNENEPILYAICGDISKKAKYSPCVLLATKSHVFTYDFINEEVSEKYAFTEIKGIYTKRLYGKGIIRLVLKDGKTTITMV